MSNLINNGQIHLFGTIVPDEWIWPEDTGYFSSVMMVTALAQFPGEVTLVVNSDGGAPTEGEAMRAAIEAHPGKVTVLVTGAAHSAASLMVMGADRIEMSAGSLMLVHDPGRGAWGNPQDLRSVADELDVMATAYAGVYAARAGITAEKAREIMRAETMFTAPEAVEAGFADAVTAQSVGVSEDPVMQYNIARAAMGAASARANAAQMKFEATAVGLETGKSQTTGQEPNATIGVETMSKPKPLAPAAPVAAPIVEPVMQEPVPAVPDAATMSATLTAERTRIKGIREAAAPFMAHVGQAEVDRMIDDGTSLADANKAIMKAAAANQPKTSRIEILRDERDTQRAGMSEAMVAQMLDRDPTDDRANDYMDMSIVEMAADLTGQRRPRSTGAKANVLMAAAHGTSDFSNILGAAFNTVAPSE